MQSVAPVALPVNVDTAGAQILDEGNQGPDQRDSRDIWLPNWVETVSHIAVDIGGSLAKVVYFTRTAKPDQPSPPAEASSSSSSSSSLLNATDPAWATSSYESPPPSAVTPSSAFSSQPHSRAASASSGSAYINRSRSPNYPHTAEGSAAVPGGTLTPTSLFPSHSNISPSTMNSHLLTRRALPPHLPGGRLNFVKFETQNIGDCVQFLKELISSSAQANNVSLEQMRQGVKLMATGGGAHLFNKVFEEELGVEVQREDEMNCLITGLNFITLIPHEAYYYSDELVDSLNSSLPHPTPNGLSQELPRPSPDPPLYAPVFDSNPLPKLPCLLVNIGSGVSIIKVDDHGKFERVSGTSLGGGTLWGLLSLLTDAESFDEMLELASQGDNGTVDMLVSDIYGSSDSLNSLGLKSNTIASSFGKVFRKDGTREGETKEEARERRKKKFRPEDICKSLLYAVSNNIGQIAYMNAEKFGLDRIYFGGCFIRGHQATIATLSYAIRFWSKGTKRAFFLRHEGYLGAIGCWIKQLSEPETSSTPSKGTKSAKRKKAAHVNGDWTDSKVATPRAEIEQLYLKANSNGSMGIGVNPILAESLGSFSLAGTPTPATQGGPIANGELRSQNTLDHVSVGLKDVQALPVGSGKDVAAASNVSSLMASLSEEDVAIMGPLLQSASTEEALSITDLMKQLDDASGAADGLESKLDSLLGRLDSLLDETTT